MHETFPPSSALRDLIECYWRWKPKAEDVAGHPILPDASPEFIVHLGEPPRASTDGRNWSLQPKAFLYSAAYRALYLKPAGPMDIFAVRFMPWGAGRFATTAMASLLDAAVPPTNAFGSFGAELSAAITEANVDEERARRTNRLFEDRLRKSSARDDRHRRFLTQIASENSAAKTKQFGFAGSERSTRRMWSDFVGVSAKKYAGLARFQKALAALDAGASPADAANISGYSDQPHMARELRSLSGLTPRELCARLGSETYRCLYLDRRSAPWMQTWN